MQMRRRCSWATNRIRRWLGEGRSIANSKRRAGCKSCIGGSECLRSDDVVLGAWCWPRQAGAAHGSLVELPPVIHLPPLTNVRDPTPAPRLLSQSKLPLLLSPSAAPPTPPPPRPRCPTRPAAARYFFCARSAASPLFAPPLPAVACSREKAAWIVTAPTHARSSVPLTFDQRWPTARSYI